MIFAGAVAMGATGCFDSAPLDDTPSGRAILVANPGLTTEAVRASEYGSALVTLDGSASSGEIISYEWSLGGVLIASGARADVVLSEGRHEVMLEVRSATGELHSATVEINVSQSQEFAVVLEVSGEGQTEPLPGTTYVASNDSVALEAFPGEGYGFVGWSGDIDEVSAVTTLNVDGPKLITAEFEACVGEVVPQFLLPWPAGITHVISQSNGGEFSHVDRFAWDFPMPMGSAIVASAPGRVVEVYDESEDSVERASNIRANSVTVDHGDGLVSMYVHLRRKGAAVSPGQIVAQGQLIGLSGDSGNSSGPHLHFEVCDPLGSSVATGFNEVRRCNGIAVKGDVVVSQNETSIDAAQAYSQSTFPANSFAINEIELTSSTLPAFFYETGREYVVSGRVLNGRTRVGAALVDPGTGATVFQQASRVADDGSFTIRFILPHDLTGRYWFGVISGDGGVAGMAPRSILIEAARDLS